METFWSYSIEQALLLHCRSTRKIVYNQTIPKNVTSTQFGEKLWLFEIASKVSINSQDFRYIQSRVLSGVDNSCSIEIYKLR